VGRRHAAAAPGGEIKFEDYQVERNAPRQA
jgi:hypothetical protein